LGTFDKIGRFLSISSGHPGSRIDLLQTRDTDGAQMDF